MIDETPYLIVDNRKISPIGWSPHSNSATDDRAMREEAAFGVVDRVTISREAREKARQQQALWEANLPALENQPERTGPAAGYLLTYSPRLLR